MRSRNLENEFKDRLLIFCAKIKNNLRKYRTKKIDNIEYSFDEVVNVNNVLYIRGWIFGKNKTDIYPSIVFKTKEDEKTFELPLYVREDVVDYYNIEKIKCGFNFEAVYKSNSNGRIYLQYTINFKKRNILIDAFTADSFCNELSVNRVVSGVESYKKVEKTYLRKIILYSRKYIITALILLYLFITVLNIWKGFLIQSKRPEWTIKFL